MHDMRNPTLPFSLTLIFCHFADIEVGEVGHVARFALHRIVRIYSPIFTPLLFRRVSLLGISTIKQTMGLNLSVVGK
jgi:hypothetical protein